jgi:hypothetical protein
MSASSNVSIMISAPDVRAFKKSYCIDENPQIGRIVLEELGNWVREPIVDVGCGMGDISLYAFPQKMVHLLDRLDFSSEPKAESHVRWQMDFWDLKPVMVQPIGTLLFSHVLQFLHQDPTRFRLKLRELKALRIIAVTNRNLGFLGELVDWADKNLCGPNPERDEAPLFADYRREGEWYFESHLACPDFNALTEQVSYLLDVRPPDHDKRLLRKFLEGHLVSPGFLIQQQVVAYSGDLCRGPA